MAEAIDEEDADSGECQNYDLVKKNYSNFELTGFNLKSSTLIVNKFLYFFRNWKLTNGSLFHTFLGKDVISFLLSVVSSILFFKVEILVFQFVNKMNHKNGT